MKHIIKSTIFILSLLFITMGCNTSVNDTPTDSEQMPSQISELETKSKQARSDARTLLKTLTDSDFLQTTEPMTERILSIGDPETELRENRAYNGVIYYKALERVKKNSGVKDNQVYATIKSGAEVNIAEDLFIYITDTLYATWNKLLKEDIVEIIYDDDGLISIAPIKKNKTKSTRQSGPINLVPMNYSSRYEAIRYVFKEINTGEYIGKYFYLNFNTQICGTQIIFTACVRNWCESYGNPDNKCSHNLIAIINGVYTANAKYMSYCANANGYHITFYERAII